MSRWLTHEQLMQLDEMYLRMYLRERVHHTVEHQLYCAIYGDKEVTKDFGVNAQEILQAWRQRGLPMDYPDIQWIETILFHAQQAREKKIVEHNGYLPRPFTQDEMETVQKLIAERRSYRQWNKDPVPDWMIDKIMEAGVWAPSGCNFQILRFIVMDRPEELQKFRPMEYDVETVKIVACMDVRPYQGAYPPPEKNKLLDVGAAMQNMCLMAHALGLGACWSTFHHRDIAAIHSHYNLPDYIEVVTYLSLGWTAEAVIPPARMNHRDAVLAWK